jgi:hypothetical protein
MENPDEGEEEGVSDPDDDKEDEEADLDSMAAAGFTGDVGVPVFVWHYGTPMVLGMPKSPI